MTERERQAERALLGSLLRWNAAIADVVPLVRREDFASDAHQRLFAAIVALFEAGKPADLVTAAERLQQRGEAQDVGYPYLAQLWDSEPTGAHAVHYASIVRDGSICRRLVQAGAEIVRDATDRVGPAEQLLEEAEKRIFAIAQMGMAGQVVRLAQALDEACEELDARASGQRRRGLATGFIDLDRLTGGLQEGEFAVVAARPSQGKTSLGLCLARNVVRRGEPALFASLEQSRVELANRLLCAQGPVDSLKLRNGWKSGEDDARINRARLELGGCPLFIDDGAQQSMLRIGANARRLKMRENIRLVVVDYLQLVDPDDRKAPRQEQVASVSRRLKQLARELQIPVVAMAQLNRGVEDRQGQRPRLSDLRESGAIEQDADVVWLLHRPPDVEGVVEVNVAKQRNGPTGEVTLTFVKRYMVFENHTPDEPFTKED